LYFVIFDEMEINPLLMVEISFVESNNIFNV